MLTLVNLISNTNGEFSYQYYNRVYMLLLLFICLEAMEMIVHLPQKYTVLIAKIH